MQVSEAMTRNVRVANIDETIEQAAQLMAGLDAGALPVSENNRLVGMITDRDIAIRAVARGKGPDTAVRDVMTDDVKYCFADQEIEEVTRNMGEVQWNACATSRCCFRSSSGISACCAFCRSRARVSISACSVF